ncbi:Glycoside hydrolase 97 [Phocaeicola salanitronis DSM 18170]|uniref:Glycoside hydrolase 97 n=1 Tax=Phocaeicola salanitronis (strain DSM 18170 / JCM 13657 / CCUG 60908 / BL78) TaxID=667015 RepID=F0R792_PHOSB|nr:glycoside hydrolase family 97 protein [Phocaeicola salanitronis]ADY36919.1 Glycoside hydrolase 97 [Phocaeicola salanitronis DSM 18170]
MRKQAFLLLFALGMSSAWAQQATVSGPDNLLKVDVSVNEGIPFYSVTYKGKTMLEDSPLGFVSNVGDFSKGMAYTGQKTRSIEESYTMDRIKRSKVDYRANELTVTLQNADKKPIDITFRVSNNDVAFRYEIPRYGDTGSIVIQQEATGFDFPSYTTTFLCPQSDPMIGWKRTKPSYEEEYTPDAPLTQRSQYGRGFTFPGLFRIGNDGWVLVSETGVDSRYCASHLSDADTEGRFTIAFPMPEENNGNGTVAPGLALPGVTPWRTVTVGDDLKPIVETTVPWDVVEPRFTSEHDYQYGKGTWSWIVWQDASINYEDQVRFIDLASAMGFQYVLIDCAWDVNIGYEKMEELVAYAHSKHVDVFLWYSSSGYWNDIVQSPTNQMDNPIVRKKAMKWLKKIGVKGIKVDFFGGDKQETMRLYEAILSDADDYGLMVIFHGCTLPRGWERMYPNYVGSEAVLASENLVFQQHFDDMEAFNACLHPFIRNTVGCMEFGGTFLNKRYNRTNDGGSVRKTTDIFQLATAVLFQNPIQNFAITPNNLTDAPQLALDFLREVPTTWDETVFLDGYPGKYVVLARRHADRWYIAGINAGKEPLKLELNLPMCRKGDKISYYSDTKDRAPQQEDMEIKRPEKVKVTLQPEGGIILVK